MKRKPLLITLILFVLAALLAAVSGPLSGAIELPAALKKFALPLLLGVAFLSGLIAFLLYSLQEQTKPHELTPSQQNRQLLLARVREFWITGVLEQSLHGAALIALGLSKQSNVLANPRHLLFEQTNQSPHMLPVGTSITQAYDKEAPGELLILGEPGSGKTTLLLELARDLLSRAEGDKDHPMPVVFNLSSWAVKRQPLTDWLIEELNTKYQVPCKIGRAWVDDDQILPLLDGLDEVALAYRAACVEGINAFHKDHGLLPLVVCSRSADHLALKQPVLLHSTVVVQPLTEQQIDEYLSSAGEQMEAVRMALSEDSVLRELVTTPLWLNVLTLAYHGVSVKDLVAAGSLEDRRRHLFNDYVMAMLPPRGAETRYTQQQTMHWLTWLARQMAHYSQTEFYIERMQPDWLPDNKRQDYRGVLSLVFGLIFGLLTGLVFGLLNGLAVGLEDGLVGVLVGVLIFGLRKEIKPAEHITWSWQKVRKRLGCGVVFGLVFGLLFVLVGRLVGGLGFVLGFGLVGVLVGGLSGEMLDTHKLDMPNRGIWRSARYGLISGLVVVLGFVLVGGLFFGQFPATHYGLLFELVVVLFLGLFLGLLLGLSLGGAAFMQHFILRWFFWRAGSLPWNYPRFLDYAAERILLHKVGGGYIFVHRLLLEYFATLDDASILSHGGAKHL